MAALLVVGRDVVTMNARREIIRDGAVLVEHGRITAVGKATDLRAAHPGVAVLGDAHAVITPGFVNAHQHLTGDRLVRSAIPDNIAAHDAIFGPVFERGDPATGSRPPMPTMRWPEAAQEGAREGAGRRGPCPGGATKKPPAASS